MEQKAELIFSLEVSLVKRLRKGDTSAFEELYFRYRKSLLAFAFKELKGEELASDAVQEVFCKLWIKRKELDANQSIKGFLFTCLKNHILNVIRSQKNEVLKNYRFASQQQRSINGTEQEVMSRELQTDINHLLSQLPELKREILSLNIYKGLSKEQIAEELNISTNTVKIYLSQSSRQLRTFIEEHGLHVLILCYLSFSFIP
ncbi:RNA polymerase sigma factor [Catalinimonas niigatensis]|uniref:RNA polymerase sigma factor n=1 Tax=Catalinimonas niigatensis TaxID=1397264 RepID=UPI002666D927|nr:RNA polymerase sigma-70 factor [Catalinimonas niigatensis]WPP50421.1 RNA polymerase sigma-70 factor [Catalinimonas niigatensis]